MIKTADQLAHIVSEYSEKLNSISEEDFSLKPSPEKWSRKEELGHLVDSAHNNLRRFVVSQYENNPKVVYDQNSWNSILNYRHQSSQFLISLWELMNRQICDVLRSMPEKNYRHMCDTGKKEPELHSLEWLAEDYVKHLLHHLHHILALQEVPY